MSTDKTFFTNEPGQTLLDRFKTTLNYAEYFDVLVGYFRFIKIAEAQNLDNKINELAGTVTRKLKKVQSIKSI